MICLSCGLDKDISHLTKDVTRKSGYKKICRTCVNAQQRANRKRNPEKYKQHDRKKFQKMMKQNPDQKLNQMLKDRYGITLKRYNEILNDQNGVCVICKRTALESLSARDQAKRLFVDHCHLTGTVRGLLCRGCNLGLGFFNESLYCFHNAIEYITESIIKTEF